MKKIIIFFAALSLFACKKEKDIKVIIEGIVMDSQDKSLQDSVKVELYTQNKNYVVYTNESGYYNLGSFPIGDYQISYSKQGYSGNSAEVKSSEALAAGDFGFNIVKSLVTYLNVANEDAIFTVYRSCLNAEPLAAANFPYTIITGEINNSITGTTDANGIISKSNLPKLFGFIVDYKLDGMRYKTSTAIDINEKNYVIVYGYNPEANFGMVNTNVLDSKGYSIKDMPVTSVLSVQFTLPVDTTSASFKVLEDGWSKIDNIHRWSNGNMKLEITPSSELLPDTEYSLSLDLDNENHSQSLNKLLYFKTK